MKTSLLLTLLTLAYTAQASFAAVVLTENFTYPDGELTTVSGGQWTVHSGTGPADVLGSAASINSTDGQDVNRLLTPIGTFYNSGNLTATSSVNFSALPTGAYFMHFKDTSTGFRARVWATTSGAAAGLFRLAISNTSTAIVPVAVDLSLGTTYVITFTLDVASGGSNLSIAGVGSATATDTTSAIPIVAVALRQNGGMGTLTIDNLTVDASAVAVPEASTAVLGLLAGFSLLRRRR